MHWKLFTLAAGASAVLCILSLGFGLLGYRESSDTRLEWISRSHAVALTSYDGVLVLIFSSGWPAGDWVNDRPVSLVGQPTPLTFRPVVVADGTIERRTFTDGVSQATVTYRGVRTNILFAVAFTLVLPAIWYVTHVRTRRRNQFGLCLACGYDLRATPDRCPECGAVPAKGAA
jgi:hypothetical protein